jgi:hypothetical protein
MLITAMAAGALLAWMSLKASVTLSVLLTVGLLTVAILRKRESPDFAGMTLLMILMLWRGEAWKTVFLQSERELSELQQRQQPPVLSTIICPSQDQSFLRGVHLLSDHLLAFLDAVNQPTILPSGQTRRGAIDDHLVTDHQSFDGLTQPSRSILELFRPTDWRVSLDRRFLLLFPKCPQRSISAEEILKYVASRSICPTLAVPNFQLVDFIRHIDCLLIIAGFSDVISDRLRRSSTERLGRICQCQNLKKRRTCCPSSVSTEHIPIR